MARATVLLLAMQLGCAPAALATSPDHPADPAAPTGRLAGPPDALQQGSASPPAPAPKPDHSGHGTEPPAPKPGHEHHH